MAPPGSTLPHPLLYRWCSTSYQCLSARCVQNVKSFWASGGSRNGNANNFKLTTQIHKDGFSARLFGYLSRGSGYQHGSASPLHRQVTAGHDRGAGDLPEENMVVNQKCHKEITFGCGFNPTLPVILWMVCQIMGQCSNDLRIGEKLMARPESVKRLLMPALTGVEFRAKSPRGVYREERPHRFAKSNRSPAQSKDPKSSAISWPLRSLSLFCHSMIFHLDTTWEQHEDHRWLRLGVPMAPNLSNCTTCSLTADSWTEMTLEMLNCWSSTDPKGPS